MSFNLLNQMLVKRIDRFSLVIKIILIIFGIGTIMSQFLKISALFDLDSERTLNFSHIVAFGIGILFWILARGKIIKKFVYYSLFSGQKKIKYLIFLLPVGITFLIVFVLKTILGARDLSYERILGEGGFIEYGTTICYILACAFAIPIGNYFLKKKQKFIGLFYYFLALFCLVIALEEISWGQTLIGWDGANFFQENNIQEETNLHNLKWFHFYLKDGIILISFLVILAQYFFRDSRFSRKLKINPKFLIPEWFLSNFFLICLLLSILVKFQDFFDFFVSKDQEVAELLLSLGFFFFVVSNYFRQSLHRPTQFNKYPI